MNQLTNVVLGGEDMEIKNTLNNAQSILNLAEEKGWSEEELAKAINLLHSELECIADSIQADSIQLL